MMNISFTDWDSGNTLLHFGIRGMKWGERRYQNPDGSLTALGKERYGVNGNRSVRGIKRDLNKLDREQTNAKARYDYYNDQAKTKLARLKRRLQKANASGDSEKTRKYKEKIRKVQEGAGKKAEDYKKLVARSEKMTNKIIKSSLAKGYSIKSRDCLRSVNKGHDAAASFLLSAGGMALASAIGVGFTTTITSYAPGKHYRVKNDGLGIRTHRSRRFAGSASLMYTPSRRS